MDNNSVKIFISYAHEDVEYKKEFISHISALVRLGIVDSWHDSRILPGNKFNTEILTALENSNLIIFLISSDFLASDYINNIELKTALERERKKEVKILPIIIRDCDFLSSPFSAYKILPDDATPVKSWKDRDEAWANVVNGLKAVLKGNDDPKPDIRYDKSTLLLKENKKKKGCSIQIIVSLCLVGIVFGLVYFFDNISSREYGNPSKEDDPVLLSPDTTAPAATDFPAPASTDTQQDSDSLKKK